MPKSALAQLQAENLKAFQKWAKANRKKLRPDDKKIKIFYADRMINMSDLGKKVKEIEKKNGDTDLGPHVAKIESYVKHITSSSMTFSTAAILIPSKCPASCARFNIEIAFSAKPSDKASASGFPSSRETKSAHLP